MQSPPVDKAELIGAFESYFAGLVDPEAAQFQGLIAFAQNRCHCSLNSISKMLGISWSNFHYHYSQSDGKLPAKTIKTFAEHLALGPLLQKRFKTLIRIHEISAEQAKQYVMDYLVYTAQAEQDQTFKGMLSYIRRAHYEHSKAPPTDNVIREALGFTSADFFHHREKNPEKLPQVTLSGMAEAIGIDVKLLAGLSKEAAITQTARAHIAMIADIYLRICTLEKKPACGELLHDICDQLQPVSKREIARIIGISPNTLYTYLADPGMPLSEKHLKQLGTLSRKLPHSTAASATQIEPPSVFETPGIITHSNLFQLQGQLMQALMEEPRPIYFHDVLQRLREADAGLIIIARLAEALGIQPAIVKLHLEAPQMRLSPATAEVLADHVAGKDMALAENFLQLLTPFTKSAGISYVKRVTSPEGKS